MSRPVFITQFVSPFIPTIHALALSMWASDRTTEHLPQIREVTSREVARLCRAALDRVVAMPTDLARAPSMGWESI